MALASLIVKIGAETSGLNKALTQAEKDVQKAGRQFSKIGSSLTKNLVVPILGIGAALTASAVKAGTFADELLDLVDMTGLSARTLQEFRHVALTAGVGADTLADAAVKLTSKLSSGDEQTKELSNALARLGLKATDANGRLVSMDVLLPNIIGRLQGMSDVTLRNTIAADVFGKSWAELAPILSMSSAEMDAARKEAQRLGLVMGDEALKQADEFRKALGKLSTTTGAITREIGVGMLPVLTGFVGLLQNDVLPAVRGVVTWIGNWSRETKIGIAWVAGLVVGFTGLVSTLGVVLKFWPLLTAGFTALIGPIGLTVAAVVALTAAGIQMVKHWDAVKLQFVLAWTAMKDAAFNSVGFVLDLLTAMTARIPTLAGKIMQLRSAFDEIAEKSMAASGRAIASLETKIGSVGTTAERTDRKVQNLVNTLTSLGSGKLAGKLSDRLAGLGMSLTPGFGGSGALTGPTKTGTMTGSIVAPEAEPRRGMFGFQPGDSAGMKVSRIISAGGGGGPGAQMIQAFAEFGPMAAILPVINGAMEKLGPAFEKLIAPLVEVGSVIGEALAPVLESLAPVVKLIVGILSTGLAPVLRIVATVFSYVVEAIGWFIKGIGALIDKLVPDWISKVGKNLAKQGQDIIDSARAARDNTKATDKATEATNKFAAALSNVPRVLNINAIRHLVTGATGGTPASPPSGGPRGGPAIVYSYGDTYITIPGAGDPAVVADAVGKVIERQRTRGGTARIALATI